MTIDLEVTILGSGTSYGVPVIGCDCEVCLSDDPRNRRLRVSILVRYNGRSVLVDTSPDLRQQALTNCIERVDAVLLTHAHADHLHGLDDLRVYCGRQQELIPFYASRYTLDRAARGFDYAFARNDKIPLGGIPQLRPVAITSQPFDLFGLQVLMTPLPHGRGATNAFRFGERFAYVTDCSDIPASKRDRLRGLDLLVLDCLRHDWHPTHLHLERALELVRELAPQQCYLTHISHDLDHATVEAQLPPGVAIAYDGLRLVLPATR